jgi:hypothetical protein
MQMPIPPTTRQKNNNVCHIFLKKRVNEITKTSESIGITTTKRIIWKTLAYSGII